MQFTVHPMLVIAATRLNPQPAMRKTQLRFWRSKLELRGPRSGRNMGHRSSPGVCSAQMFRGGSESADKSGD
eukprot:1658303-Alexandrium_andersonii.AAC.1